MRLHLDSGKHPYFLTTDWSSWCYRTGNECIIVLSM